jgi:hypothetical protein
VASGVRATSAVLLAFALTGVAADPRVVVGLAADQGA